MKQYELAYLISSDVTEEELKNNTEKVISLIQEEGGVLGNLGKPEKRKLGYPIKGKQEAFLVCVDFSINPEKIKKIKDVIDSKSEILRDIITVKEKEVEAKKKRSIAGKRSLKTSKEKKVELEKIDEKIDEILK